MYVVVLITQIDFKLLSLRPHYTFIKLIQKFRGQVRVIYFWLQTQTPHYVPSKRKTTLHGSRSVGISISTLTNKMRDYPFLMLL